MSHKRGIRRSVSVCVRSVRPNCHSLKGFIRLDSLCHACVDSVGHRTTQSTMSSPQEQAQIASANPSGTIKTSVSIYLPILGIGFVAFEVLRRRFRRVYDSSGTDGNVFWNYAALARTDRLFGWIPVVYKTSDDEIMERCGLDTLCYLRFLRMGQKVALVAVVFSVVLFPLYATATPPTTSRTKVDTLELITMSNVANDDWRLWASVVASAMVMFFTMCLLVLEYQHYAMRRHELLSKPEASAYTVLVHDLPLKLRTRQTLEQYMRKVFPNTVHSVYVAVECKRLEELVDEREEARNAVEHALALMEKKRGVRPTHREGGSWLGMLTCQRGSRGRVVDSIDFYNERLAKLNEMVAREIDSIEEAQARLAQEVEREEHGPVRPPPTMPPEQEQRLADHLEEGVRRDQQLTKRNSSRKRGLRHALTMNLTARRGSQSLERTLAQDEEVDDEDEDEDAGTEEPPGTELDQELRDRSRRLHPIRVMRRTAFISFTSLRSAQVAQQAVQSHNPVAMSTAPAPHVADVHWSHLGQQYRTRSVSQLIVTALTATIVIFWTIPTAFITSLATVESLRKMLPFLNKAFDAHPFLITIFKQLSPLALVILSALAPVIFGLLARRELHTSDAEASASVFTKLAYFQLIQIFFVTVIVGTVIDSLKEILDQPKTLISMLGRSMPQQSTFFMSYVIVRTGLSLVMELLRVGPFVLSLIFKCFAPRLTRRERHTPWLCFPSMTTIDPFDPSSQLADAFLVMLVTLTFSTIAPLVCYFTAFFFFVAEIVYRRQVLFVYRPSVHSMGAYWPRLYNFLIVAMVVAQFTLLGLLSLKKSPATSVIVIVLLTITFLFHHYVSRLFPRVAKYLPLTDCVRLDEIRYQEHEQNPQKNTFGFLDNVYRQPAMSQRRPLRVDYQMLEENDDIDQHGGLASSPEMHDEDQRLFQSSAL